ncbi:MAG: ATP-binding protein [Candidatus Heimdallarchaeaceae archaeon]
MDSIGEIIGVFIGLESSSYEYIANIIAPFQSHYIPTVGSFILIDSTEEYTVARVMDYVPKSEITSHMGLKWLGQIALTPEKIGQDIKRSKVNYMVKIKLLGRLSKSEPYTFLPGISKIPHITTRVLNPSHEVTEIICNKALESMADGVSIGNYWLDKNIEVKFNLSELLEKRSFIFARAGYGKSNLMKVLLSNWNKDFGSIIVFDPEGEYAVTDKKRRPGLMDKVPALLITNNKGLERQLSTNVYCNLKFNLKEFHPSFIIPIIVPEGKHETIFFSKLMGLSPTRWSDLVDLFYSSGWLTSEEDIRDVMGLDPDDNSPTPIRNNLVNPIRYQLHDPNSQLLELIKNAVLHNEIIILDISLLNSQSALRLSSLIIGYFFNENQKRFTSGKEDLYKIVFAVEEAQSVIGKSTNIGKFVELAKEGRKYQLGAVFITQQPGSISKDILSQGDNFFVFHLLSKTDLRSLNDANAHFSEDILTQILNEPVKGKSYMWTSEQPFVIPVNIHNYEEMAIPNNSNEIQKENDILIKILSKIEKIDSQYQDILKKFLDYLYSLGIDVDDEDKIISDKYITRHTKDFYNLLNDSEKKILENEHGLQANQTGDGYFAIFIPYFRDKLYQKAKMFYKINKIIQKESNDEE